MAKKSRPTFQKLNKEKARQRKQEEKAVRRLQAKQRRIDAKSGQDEAVPEMVDRRAEPQSFPALVESARPGE
jgi:hypothetical protein